MNKRQWMDSSAALSILLTVILCGCVLSLPFGAVADSAASVEASPVTDYAQRGNWLTADTSCSKPVDIFYLYPTAYQKGAGDGDYCAVDNVSMVKGANGAFNRQATAFLTVGNIYAPYYRQADAGYIFGLPTADEQDEAIRRIPAADAIAAFQYYIDHYNQGRPFILAGHSQGSNVLLFILSEIRDQPEVYNRMVAAYVIGFSVTREYLDQNPPLTFASGPDDTGVIISYNTEAKGVTESPVVRPGALAINPITWTLDETEAPKEDNLGSITLITSALADLTPVMNFASAQVDSSRGVVLCKSVDPPKFSLPGMPAGVYHTYDYPFYFYNIRANAQNRVDHYLKSHP